LQSDAVISHRHRDRAIIGGKRYSHGQSTVQVIATPMATRVAQRLLHRAQQQICHDGRKRVGGDSRLVWRIERQFVECTAELAVQRGAQSAYQPMFEAPLVRDWGSAHQRRQIMMG
jgi:hypothetical protein